MSRYIDAEWLKGQINTTFWAEIGKIIDNAPTIDIVRCSECKKSHIDGKTTHYLWCTEWGRSTDTFGFCERADRKE